MRILCRQFKFYPIIAIITLICLYTACYPDPDANLPAVGISNITRTDDGTSDDTISISWSTDTAADLPGLIPTRTGLVKG
jgi:hypothetical protein